MERGHTTCLEPVYVPLRVLRSDLRRRQRHRTRSCLPLDYQEHIRRCCGALDALMISHTNYAKLSTRFVDVERKNKSGGGPVIRGAWS